MLAANPSPGLFAASRLVFSFVLRLVERPEAAQPAAKRKKKRAAKRRKVQAKD